MRTADSDSVSRGSNPRPPATETPINQGVVRLQGVPVSFSTDANRTTTAKHTTHKSRHTRPPLDVRRRAATVQLANTLVEREREVAAGARSAYVYVIRMSGTRYHKIGITDHPSYRMGSLQAGNPLRLDLVAAVWVEDAITCERELHALMRPYRTQGEWFSFDPNYFWNALGDARYRRHLQRKTA